MRWTLVVLMDRKVFVANVDSEVIGRQVVPNVARVVARVMMMARDRARKASQAKAKMMMAKGKAKGGKWQARKAFDGYCNHSWKWGHMEKDCFTKSKSKGGKCKSAGSLDESEENGPENTSVGGFGLCSFRNHCDDWNWNNCRKVTFTRDSGVAVSAAR